MEEVTAPSIGLIKMSDEGLENPAVAARRRRKEIRRLKVIANAVNMSTEPMSKRSRPITSPSSIVDGDGDMRPPEPELDVVTRSFDSFPNVNDDEERVTDDCNPETMFDPLPSSLSLLEEAETLSVETCSLASYNSEEESVASMDIDLLHEDSNIPFASDDSSFSAGELCGKEIVSDRSTNCSDFDICGFETSEAVKTSADVVPEGSIAGPDQVIPFCVDQQLVSEVDSVVVDAPNRLDCSIPGTSGGSVSSGKVNCCIDSNRIPPWAHISIPGRRPEMEDSVASVPGFFSLPCRVVGGCTASGSQKSNESSPLHFFGVYDGHGGAQASNFCKDRLHQALVEELEAVISGERSSIDGSNSNWKRLWERALVSCFKKVDAEVGQEPNRRDDSGEGNDMECCSEPIAPETVGTTAVIAIVGSCQVIIANCGDSRAVLCRGGKAIPLSDDHKPQRADEMARIEAAGGKVICWNGYRVLGVLAMSRAIGDRYLKPSIIPDPDITFTERVKEDECLILASDGLWDVISNEEACDIARRRIAHWHNKNPVSSLKSTDQSMDPAAQSAANHLCKLAIQRGSSDNITVLVVDLKAKRRRARRS